MRAAATAGAMASGATVSPLAKYKLVRRREAYLKSCCALTLQYSNTRRGSAGVRLRREAHCYAASVVH